MCAGSGIQPRQTTPYTGSGIRGDINAPKMMDTGGGGDSFGSQQVPTNGGAQTGGGGDYFGDQSRFNEFSQLGGQYSPNSQFSGALGGLRGAMQPQNPMAGQFQRVGGFGMGQPLQGGGFQPPGLGGGMPPGMSSVDPKTGQDLPQGSYSDPKTGQVFNGAPNPFAWRPPMPNQFVNPHVGPMPQGPMPPMAPEQKPAWMQQNPMMAMMLGSGANPNWQQINDARGPWTYNRG